jgi:hypothetical protein
VNNVTINPTTTCLNIAEITQLVEQYCVSCTLIMEPPPPPLIVSLPAPVVTTDDGSDNAATTVDVTTVVSDAAATTVVESRSVRALAYCLPHPALQAHGVMSSLIYLDVGQRLSRRDEGAVPATYRRGAGMTCPHLANAIVHSQPTRMFTLTVPVTWAGQDVRLCVESSTPFGRTLCRDIPILGGATVKVPVAGDVSAKVIKAPSPPPKSRKQISHASSAYLFAGRSSKSKAKDGHASARPDRRGR